MTRRLADVPLWARLVASMLVVVSVEFIQASDGVGWLIWNSWTLLATSQMYAGIVAVSVTGVVLTQLIRILGRLLLPWAKSGTTNTTPF